MRQPLAPSKKPIYLKKRGDFLKTYKGRSIRRDFFTLFYAKNSFGQTRFGITVPKQVGPAVIRNRYKRWARELFRKKNVVDLGVDFNLLIGSKRMTKADFKKVKGKDFFEKVEEVLSEAFGK